MTTAREYDERFGAKRASHFGQGTLIQCSEDCKILWNTHSNRSSHFHSKLTHLLTILHYDNALSHITLIVSKLLVKISGAMLPHPPCCPDLAPVDFLLFSLIKRILKGTQYGRWWF
ncbi:hypothetical protein TNCV_244331 [Trichonephila clavipes]|uniref:Uncharacterized protein n=1 Tax=Trichonephila clavipes TaxID=2585209 RepID=A0A8X6UXL0_TRICX|nr:hypothetical protein TNCV_244331 [Trichonephila clavipes]